MNRSKERYLLAKGVSVIRADFIDKKSYYFKGNKKALKKMWCYCEGNKCKCKPWKVYIER